MPSSQRPEYQTAAARIFPTKGHAVTMTTFQGGEIQGKHPFLLFADGINLESISFGRRRLRLHSDRKDGRTQQSTDTRQLSCLFAAWRDFRLGEIFMHQEIICSADVAPSQFDHKEISPDGQPDEEKKKWLLKGWWLKGDLKYEESKSMGQARTDEEKKGRRMNGL